MSDLGKVLQQARKKKRLSLEKVHKLTRISQAYLIGLEESNAKAFPAEVYYKNFLKNYAKFLELDVEEIVKMYENEKADKQNDLFANINNNTNEEIKKTKNIKAKNKKNNQGNENSENNKITNELDNKKILYAKIVLIVICCVLFVCVISTILKSKNSCNISQTSQIQQSQIEKENAEENITKQTLTIEATNKVNVVVCADNKEIFKGTLYSNQQQICYANESFSITIDDIKNLKLYFNDKVVDIEKFVEKNKSNTLNFNKDTEF